METKKCSKCNKKLPVLEFDKRKNEYSCWCKECRRAYARNYTAQRKSDPEWCATIKKAQDKYYASEKGRAKRDEYKKTSRADLDIVQREQEYGRNYYHAHSKVRKNRSKQWICDNPERMKELRKRAYEKRKKNPVANLSDRIRGALKKAIRKNGLCKSGMSFELLGYSPLEAYGHLSQYLAKQCEVCREVIITMSNCHLDHMSPIRLAKSLDAVIKMNALQNLRLICGQCNLQKGGRM